MKQDQFAIFANRVLVISALHTSGKIDNDYALFLIQKELEELENSIKLKG